MIISVGADCIKLFDQTEETDPIVFPFETLRSYKFNTRKKKGAFQMLDPHTKVSEWVTFKTDSIKPIEFEIKARIQDLMNKKFGKKEIDWSQHTHAAKKVAKKIGKEQSALESIKSQSELDTPKRKGSVNKKKVQVKDTSGPANLNSNPNLPAAQLLAPQAQMREEEEKKAGLAHKSVSETDSESDGSDDDDQLFNPFQQMTLSMGLNTPNLFQNNNLASNPFGTIKFTTLQQSGGAGPNPFATNNFNAHSSVNFGSSTFSGLTSSAPLSPTGPIAPHSPLAQGNPFATTGAFNPHTSVNFSAQAQNPFATNVHNANPSPFAGLTASPGSSSGSFNLTSPTATPSANPFGGASQAQPSANPFATNTPQSAPLTTGNPFATNLTSSNPQLTPFGSPSPALTSSNPFAPTSQPVNANANPFATTGGY